MSNVTNEEKQETRLRIQKAAKEIFLKKGIKGASVREIAKKAGIGASTLYGYYSSKELMFIEIILPSIKIRNDLNIQLNELEVIDLNIDEVTKILTDTVFSLPISIFDIDQKIIKEFHSVLFSISSSDEIKNIMKNFMENEMKVIIANFIKRLLDENVIKVKIDAEEFALYILNSMRMVFLEYIIIGDLTKETSYMKLKNIIRMSLIGKL
jgi:AcrR family transcriptional regulator